MTIVEACILEFEWCCVDHSSSFTSLRKESVAGEENCGRVSLKTNSKYCNECMGSGLLRVVKGHVFKEHILCSPSNFTCNLRYIYTALVVYLTNTILTYIAIDIPLLFVLYIGRSSC